MTIFVGSGRSTPRPANSVAKMGTTFPEQQDDNAAGNGQDANGMTRRI